MGLSGTESPRVGRRAALERASDGDDSAVTTLDRSDDASDDVEGVSFESGRGPGGTTALRRAVVVVVLARETVECVLRAAERTELADEWRDSRPFGRVPDRLTALLRIECMLADSASSRFVTLRVAFCDIPLPADGDCASRSSTGTSISARESD